MWSFHLSLLALFVLSGSWESVAEKSESLKNCTEAENAEAARKCNGLIGQLKYHVENDSELYTPQGEYRRRLDLCVHVPHCLSSFKCKEVQLSKETIEKSCNEHFAKRSGLPDCLPKFVEAVHNKKYPCSENYKFLSTNITERSKAFNDNVGRYCFHNITRSECPSSASGHIYGNFRISLDLITKKDEDCDGFFVAMNNHICKVLEKDIWKASEKVKAKGQLVMGVWELQKACKTHQECVKNGCGIDDETKNKIQVACGNSTTVQ